MYDGREFDVTGVRIVPGADETERNVAGDADYDFRALFVTHPTPMWVYDPETLRFLTVNDAAVRLYGYPAEAYAHMTVLDIRPKWERERMLVAVQARSDIERAERWQHLKADGEIMDVLTYGRAVRFDGVDAILAIVTDRTEVNRAYRQASDTRSLLDSIVTNLPIGVFVKDMADDGRYILYNASCGEIVGYDPDYIVGKTDFTIFTPEQAAQFRRQDGEALGGSGLLAVEEDVVRSDGAIRTIRTVKRAIPTADGSPQRYLVGISEDVTERRSYEARISHLAMHDARTGLPNRAFFADHMGALLTLGERCDPFALLYIDVDHFKHINDSMGHPAGDALLCEVAERLKGLVGAADMVARLGGDEFALIVMLKGADARAEAAVIADRVMLAFSEPFQLEGVTEHVDCSVGVALAPWNGDDVNLLLRNADLALYAAKGDGRSTFRFYERSMRLNAEKRHALTVELRRALVENEFELHYQPIISLSDDSISGFEALVRWNHPERGQLAPSEFIPVAEETGLIMALGDWVIREACRTAATWPASIKVAVNLSPCQFRQVGLLATVVAALDEAKLSPSRLELEITESVLLSESGQNLQLLHALRALGVRIAMDDFGTGYSSLSYLRSFPFDKIKMDRSFVSGIDTDPGSLAIVRAVTGLGSGFNLTTTAEGVETPEQLLRLRREGFGEIQGFLVARPMPAGDVPGFIARHHGINLDDLGWRRKAC
ncbi:MAG: EAL domain-containing protein [Mesorhizobium sp.]|nr:EAL domain-containing protein [Mesorhizobium sp.]